MELELSILLPALLAGLLVSATHVPLGMRVLARGIVFIDIAIAQIAGVGVIAASMLGFEEGMAVQFAALTTALVGALLLTWTEKRWPEVQEAIIGSVFVLAATLSVLLLAGNPHAGEHLREMLIGQILWVGKPQLIAAGVIAVAVCGIWFGAGEQRVGRIGFYALFGLAVTASVQLVGIYLVFSTLIIPALATRNAQRHRLAKAYGVAALGYALGLLASVVTDLPTGPMIVWAHATVGILAAAFEGYRVRLS